MLLILIFIPHSTLTLASFLNSIASGLESRLCSPSHLRFKLGYRSHPIWAKTGQICEKFNVRRDYPTSFMSYSTQRARTNQRTARTDDSCAGSESYLTDCGAQEEE
ncbi:hypothetical protein EVAR_95176_1 [Eumeta japonica]|uniref:Secreted protein n=1 Tax=Eumeta variegata TaxID=151549 RepID=A0A4C1VHU0_EUMVA|nr:hypothetical protein EVAR_95176_1 [Eumeta japonica]